MNNPLIIVYKAVIKKTIFLVCLIFFQITILAQDYLQIGFNADNSLPTVDSSGEFVILTFADEELTEIFESFDITVYKKEYPSVTFFTHPLVAKLNRVYKIKTAANINSLYSALVTYASPTILTLYILDETPELLYTPNDYVSDFSPCAYCTFSPSTFALKQLELINAKDAWDITTGSSNIRIGISDLQMYTSHPDLVNQFVAVHPDAVVASSGHGTRVSGCAAAETNNGVGISAIGFNCKLVALPFGDYNAFFDAAVTYGVKVINCSWGHCGSATTHQEVIDILYDAGVTIIAAAGNGNLGANCGSATALMYPASYDKVISVTGVGHVFDVSESRSCSSGGLTYYGNNKDVHNLTSTVSGVNYTYYLQHNSAVDICAPGYDVTTTQSTSSYQNCFNSGTSFAAPIVSGAAGLIYSIKKAFQPDEIEACIKCTAFDVYSLSQNSAYTGQLGAGRLDAEAALIKAQGLIANKPSDIIWSYDDANTLRRVELDPAELGLLLDDNLILNNTIYCEAVPSSSTPSISDFQWLIKSLGFGNVVRKTGNPISIQLPDDFDSQSASCFLSVNARNNVTSLCDNDASSYYGEVADMALTGMVCPAIPEPLGSSIQRITGRKNLEESKAKTVRIYPNPARQEALVALPDEYDVRNGILIEIRNSTGQLVKKLKIYSKIYRISLIDFTSGIYWVNIISAKNKVVKPLVVGK